MEICEMKRYLIGVVTFVLVLVNALQVIVIVTPLGLLRFIPIPILQRQILMINEKFGEMYLYFNSRIQDLMHKPNYEVFGEEKLKRDIWQFTTINHLSWADIFIRLNAPPSTYHSTIFGFIYIIICLLKGCVICIMSIL